MEQLLLVSKCASCYPVGQVRRMQRRKILMIWSNYTKEYFQMVTSPASSKFGKTCGAYPCTPIPQKPSQLHSECVTKPQIFTLLQIGATLLVTVCTAERSFSSMKLLKSYLRSKMEDRLSNLALIYIHKDVEINDEEVIDRYAAKNRRLNFV